jgi:hypothetical protein
MMVEMWPEEFGLCNNHANDSDTTKIWQYAVHLYANTNLIEWHLASPAIIHGRNTIKDTNRKIGCTNMRMRYENRMQI